MEPTSSSLPGTPQKQERGLTLRRRTGARLAAVQAVYQALEMASSPDHLVSQFRENHLPGEPGIPSAKEMNRTLFEEILRGTVETQEETIRQITAVLPSEWPWDRLDPVLKGILMCGFFELSAHLQTPTQVIISEYIDIAHGFYEGKEAGFVNALLDRLAQKIRS